MSDCNLCEYLEQNPEYQNYINSRLSSKGDLKELLAEIKEFNGNTAITLNDLTKHQKNCCLLVVVDDIQDNSNNGNNSNNSLTIDFDSLIESYKQLNQTEQNNICYDLLAEINYKLLYIINAKLDFYKDKIPKDDIQAFKVINEVFKQTHLQSNKF